MSLPTQNALRTRRRLRAVVLTNDEKVPEEFAPNAFIRIGTDGQVTIIAKHDEMGQGIHTGLAIAICEELEIDVEKVRVVPAPANASYGNSAYQVQVTGGSTSTWSSFDQQRRAGAVARTMLIAAAAKFARCPYFGGTLKRFDGEAARAMPGVKAVIQVPSGVAVIATGFWAAEKARETLEVQWEPGPGGMLDSERLFREYREKSETPGLVARKDGDAEAAFAGADKIVEATYEVPFQAHAPMEPLSCLVTLREGGGADIVTGSQMFGADHPAAARRLGVPIDQVRMTNSYLGGGFGRRANPQSDFVLEAVEVAIAAKHLKAPIQTVWTRQDDLHGGWYRPMFVNAVKAGIRDGKVVAWRHRVVGQSISEGTPFAPMLIQNGVDTMSVEGASDMPHGIPNLSVELHTVSLPVPVLWWRSVGHSNTAFAKESVIDECAVAMEKDPYELRRELLADHPRLLRVLDLVAEKANWKKKPKPGVGRGIAAHESFKGFAAHAVEASVEGGVPKIHRVVCAIDCGLVVNPDQVESQMQGAANFALSATLHSQITFKDGQVEQTNFHDFEIVRMNESPRVEVHIVDSSDPMGGIGEVGVPGIASATCSALFEACGKRVRSLPVGDQLAEM